MEQYLFWNKDSYQFFREKEKILIEEINSLTKEELKNSDDSIKILLKTKHNIKKIELGEIYQEDKGEENIDVRNDHRFAAFYDRKFHSNPVLRKGRKIEINLPFSCEEELLLVRPSTQTTVIPKAIISDNLIFPFVFMSGVDTPEDIKTEIDKEIELTKRYASWLNNDIESFNNKIDSIIDNSLRSRREKLSFDEDFLKNLDIPKKEAEFNIGFIKPEKKFNLKILEENKEKEIEPALKEETYNEIIGFIDSLGINLERSYERLRGLDEESLRDSILMALNSVYLGMASSEAFNKSGKTDICIKYKNSNIFIAECKIWYSEKNFNEGLDQLFSYLTWRDTKTGYIIFSRNANFNKILGKSKELIQKHNLFLSEISNNSESSIKYKFKQNNSKKEVFVNLHIFNLS